MHVLEAYKWRLSSCIHGKGETCGTFKSSKSQKFRSSFDTQTKGTVAKVSFRDMMRHRHFDMKMEWELIEWQRVSKSNFLRKALLTKSKSAAQQAKACTHGMEVL